MADRETAGLKETDRKIIEEIFKVRIADGHGTAGGGDGTARASWQEQLGVFILESGPDGEEGWEPFSPTRDIRLALQALHALVRRGWRYDLRVTSARAVLYLFDGSRELEGVAPLRGGNLSAALPVAISRGVARALEEGHSPAGLSSAPRRSESAVSLPAHAPLL